MNATGATLVFSVPFAAMGLAGAYREGIGIALLSFAITLPAGAFAFWFGARRVRHKWYSALISGVFALAVALETLHVLNPVLSLWLLLLAIEVAIAVSGFLLGRMPLFPEVANETRRSSPSEHRQEQDYIYVGMVCVCVITLAVPVAAGHFSLQHQLPPVDSLLSGPTQSGEMMFLIPTIVISSLAGFWVAWPLTKWVRRLLSLPERSPFVLAGWTKSIDWRSINWRLAGGIVGVVLVLVAAKGFGSYFYVTESGISVRPPLEFSTRHYKWKDVTAVKVRSIRSIVKSKNRFRYVLKMSDGYEVDLSGARRHHGAGARCLCRTLCGKHSFTLGHRARHCVRV